MAAFFMGAALLVLLLTAIGLLRLLRGPGQADRVMSAQIFGTGGVAVLMLVAAAGDSAALDVALLLALLSAFVSLAFAVFADRSNASPASGKGGE